MRNINTINGRIIQIIDEDCGGNRSEFARRLEITPTYAAQLYKGERIPGDRIVSSICREFNVRREWLETGEGPMRYPQLDTDMELINALLVDEPAATVRFVKRFMRVYLQLTPDRQAVMDEVLEELSKQE